MSKEAMKLALEALEFIPQSGSMLGSQAETKRLQAIAVMKEALAQQALDKMAENARELGLDYEPAPMSQPNRAIAYSAASKLRELGYEWVADAWKQPAPMIRGDIRDGLVDDEPAQQEPVAWMHEWEDGERIPMLTGRDDRNTDKPKSVRPLVFGDTSSPAQRKPLTPEWIWTWLMGWCWRNGSSPANYNSLFKMVADARAIEAKLMEKNT